MGNRTQASRERLNTNQAPRPAHLCYTHGGLSSTEALWRVDIIRDLSKYLFPNRVAPLHTAPPVPVTAPPVPVLRHHCRWPSACIGFYSKDDSNEEQRPLTKRLASPPENTMIESLLGLWQCTAKVREEAQCYDVITDRYVDYRLFSWLGEGGTVEPISPIEKAWFSLPLLTIDTLYRKAFMGQI